MKRLQNLTIALGIGAFLFSFSTPSFAEWKQPEQRQKHIKTMRDAAAALETTNADLAKDLNQFADEEEKLWEKKREKTQAFVKDLRDSANALQTSNPDLAKGLTDLADRKEKWASGTETSWQKEDWDADIKLLRDASASLQTTNADLAGKLSTMADKKEAMKQWKDEGEEVDKT